MNEAVAVRHLVLAYESTIHRITGNEFIRASLPKPDSISFNNSAAVCAWLETAGKTPAYYMEMAHGLFDKDWCEKIFKRPYVPYNVAVSGNSLKKIIQATEKIVLAGSENSIREIVGVIRKHPDAQWQMILDNVYGYLPGKVKEAVRKELFPGWLKSLILLLCLFSGRQ